MQEYVDGGLSSNLPKFTDRQTIGISPFSGEADISPKDAAAVFDWRVTLAKQVVKVCFILIISNGYKSRWLRGPNPNLNSEGQKSYWTRA